MRRSLLSYRLAYQRGPWAWSQVDLAVPRAACTTAATASHHAPADLSTWVAMVLYARRRETRCYLPQHGALAGKWTRSFGSRHA